jgi:hypothetical protein
MSGFFNAKLNIYPMKYLVEWRIFESKEDKKPSKDVENEIKRFKSKWGIELDQNFTLREIKVISEGLSYYNTKFIKNRIDRIIRKDMGAVKGRWKNTEKKKWMFLNPKIFNFKKRWKNEDVDIPYAVFTVVHETAHCIDYLERISFSKEWQSLSGFKKCDIHDKVPDGYIRYIERRPGRKGPKKSEWIHKEDSNFCRKYSSKNPREDFADSLAFTILGLSEKMKGEDGKEKLKIIKKLLKRAE